MAHVNRFAAHHGGWNAHAIAWTAGGVVLLWITGIVLYVWPAEVTFQLAAWQVALRRAALVVHGGSVWVLCLLAGRWVWPHIAQVWSYRRGSTWVLGIAGATLLLAVALTGFLLLYGPEPAHAAASAVHWWTALALPALFALHGRKWLRRG